MLKRDKILSGFNLASILICIFFTIFSISLVQGSKYYYLFVIAAILLTINQILISKQYFRVAFYFFTIITNGLMVSYDAGILNATRSFVFYIPLLLSNLIISDTKSKLERFVALGITILSIVLVNFTTFTPKLAQTLFDEQIQVFVAYINITAAMLMCIFMTYYIYRMSADATEQLLRSNEAVRQNELLLKSINQNIDEGICRTEVGTNRFVYLNAAKISMFGYNSIEEMLQVSPDTVYANVEDRVTILKDLEEHGFVKNREIQFKRKDGSVFWGLLNTNRLIDDRGNVLYDGALRDITELRALKAELIAAKDAAEKSSQAKSNFLSAMSHEIRTPMNAVIGASNLLLMEKPMPGQLENLLLLKSAGNNLMRLINNVLDFAKIEADKLEFERIPVDLALLIKEIVDTHKVEAGRKSVSLKMNIQQGNHHYLIDPIWFTQVMNNLVGNAVKFTHEGHVVVEIFVTEQSASHASLHFSVSDTGVGIATDRIDKIFEHFGQEELSTKRRFGGSGLGLAIAKRILERLNSTLYVQSVKGKGSTFSFSLTLQKYLEQKDLASPVYQNAGDLKGLKILVVEDNEANNVIFSRFLQRWGADFYICTSGAEAIHQVGMVAYDVVLMDLHVPDMDGFEATQKIRQIRSQLPIIAISADAFSETRALALKAGMNEFITKPFNPDELLNKLCQYKLA